MIKCNMNFLLAVTNKLIIMYWISILENFKSFLIMKESCGIQSRLFVT